MSYTSQLINPSVGDTFTHTADCLIEIGVAAMNTTSVMDVAFRGVDALNRWAIRFQSGGAILLRRIGGGPSNRGSAGSVVDGDRVTVKCEGSIIRVYVNSVLRLTHDEDLFTTATAGRVDSLSGGAISILTAWPWPLPPDNVPRRRRNSLLLNSL